MSPWEFWIEFDTRADQHRRSQRTDIGGKSVPVSALEEARAKARALHKAKKEKKAQEAA
jgi:hypothetical protein